MHVDAPAAGGASADASVEPEALHAVRVQRVVDDEDEEHWLCPQCDWGEPDVVAVVQVQAPEEAHPAVDCTRECLTGRLLQADMKYGFTQRDCFITRSHGEAERMWTGQTRTSGSSWIGRWLRSWGQVGPGIV